MKTYLDQFAHQEYEQFCRVQILRTVAYERALKNNAFLVEMSVSNSFRTSAWKTGLAGVTRIGILAALVISKVVVEASRVVISSGARDSVSSERRCYLLFVIRRTYEL